MKKEETFAKNNHGHEEVVKNITVRLDEHTFVTLRRRSSFEKWKERYPKAKIIE
jgi:hypothetical protein